MPGDAKPPPTADQLWAAMRRDTEGLRDLQRYLESIKDLDDEELAETIGGVDRAEAMELLARLDHLLAELDGISARIHLDSTQETPVP